MTSTRAAERTEIAVTAAKPSVRRVRWRRLLLGEFVLRLLVVAAALGLWQILSGPVLPTFAVSNPVQVSKSLGHYLTSSSGWASIGVTAEEVAWGYLLGVVIGTIGALIFGTYRKAGRVFEPLIAAFNGIPKIALAPVFLVFFGLGIWSKVAIAVMGVSFIMFYNLYLGLRTVRKELIDVVRVMGGTPRTVLMYVTGPSLTSPFFAGLKAGGPMAILGVVAGEFVASFNGVGHDLANAGNALNASGVFADLIVLVAMTLLINGALGALDRWAQKKMGINRSRTREG